MILPIYSLQPSDLHRCASEVTTDFIRLSHLIKNMWETMYFTNDIALAAPQVGYFLQIMVFDTTKLAQNYPNQARRVLINPVIKERKGKPFVCSENEISSTMQDTSVRVSYVDEYFNEYEEVFYGITARLILHKMNCLQRIQFCDLLSSIRQRLTRRRVSVALNF